MTNLADIGKKIKDTTQALAKADSELKWELAASAADVAGMVDPTPTSDLIGAGLAVRKGDWLGAGMSLASTVPYLGDALAKPAKAVRAAKRINELRQTVTKLTAKLADLRKTEKQAQAAEAAAKKAQSAKEASQTATAKSAKQMAGGQNSSAKGGKDKDCEDCGPAGQKKPPAQPRLPETKVPCFHPFDKKKFMRLPKDEQKAYLQNMSKQLSRQQDAINSLTADDFKTARDAFKSQGRNPTAALSQDDFRAAVKERIKPRVRRSLQARGMSAREAIAKAEARTEEIMTKLAALHEPDMVAGGWAHPEPKGMGRADVNSSIGGSWMQAGRIAALDDAAEKAIASGQGTQMMNAKLELCRGKGLR